MYRFGLGSVAGGLYFYCYTTTGWAKKRATLLLSMSSPIIDRFSKLFYWHTLQTICDNGIIIDPTTP